MAPSSVRARPRGGGVSSAGGFYRLARMLHGYLSAFAFLILLFFSITGLTLNHPEWLAGRRSPERTVVVQVPRIEIAQAMQGPASTAARALARSVGHVTPLVGAYASGDIADGQALIRLEGPRGVTDVTVTLATGQAEVTTRRATAVAMLNDLHKGKAAGRVWKLVIDASAGLFILLSLLGYVLFFSLRLRLKLSLILTGLSLALLVGAMMLLVG
jgi:hypothetical protein